MFKLTWNWFCKHWHYILIVFLCMCMVALILGVYISIFDGGLSNEQEDFGTFGDFIGGTLNPFFGLLSFIALLFTIKQQTNAFRADSKRISNQQMMNDLFKIISKLVDRINNNYNKNLLDDKHSIHRFIIIGSDIMNMEDEDFKCYDSVMVKMKDSNSRTYKIVSYIVSDLTSLGRFLIEYEELSDCKSSLRQFYCSEYAELISVFVDNEWVSPELSKFYEHVN